jgi:tetratricopeptide (TPR) repeat protein
VCDALLAAAKTAGRALSSVVLIDPLDGRHDLAHVMLEEANRRGWGFARHVPRGQEAHLLDLDGADAEPALAASEIPARLGEIGGETQGAIDASELGEALALARQAMTLLVRHRGFWHADTLWIASSLMDVAAQTGADENIDEAVGLIEHVIGQPLPAAFDDPTALLGKLDEAAHSCMDADRPELALHLLDRCLEVARQAFGENDENYLGVLNNRALLLSALQRPEAEAALRELLRSARTILGEKHENVAVVLNNLAELLESQRRGAEAAPLRAEAESIRAAAPG